MDKESVLSVIKETGVVAILRADAPDDLIEAGRALSRGGVRCIEFTMTVPGALDLVGTAGEALRDEDVLIGMGTVLDAETARAAIDAGAAYIVTPVMNPDVITACNDAGVAVMPGAMTPTEILAAWNAGADVVKVFPAGVGGPPFFKDLKGPLPHIEIMPTGGVSAQTAGEFIKAGACAIGVGSALAGKPLIAKRDFATITNNAETYIDLVKEARDGP